MELVSYVRLTTPTLIETCQVEGVLLSLPEHNSYGVENINMQPLALPITAAVIKVVCNLAIGHPVCGA
jgi:hypothetical protein